jgi:hypothetical protein
MFICKKGELAINPDTVSVVKKMDKDRTAIIDIGRTHVEVDFSFDDTIAFLESGEMPKVKKEKKKA